MKLFAALLAGSDALVRMNACDAVNKPSFCAVITPKITRTNAWTCKDCFNLRIEVDLNKLGAVGEFWDNKDNIFLTFDNDVSFVKAAGPAQSPAVEMARTDSGYQMWKVGFQNTFNPGDRRIDINVEFKEAGATANLLVGEFCPSCIDRPVADSCDANNLVGREPGAGEWDCRVSRKWEKMNRCRFLCDNGTITGYARCFRFEDHKKFALGWVEPQNRPFQC